jgi:anaerobic magnesium-protoporphyrin IX monomethyl ester cyclase
MNVLFIHTLADAALPPARPLNSWTKIQLGISYIASVIKEAGHKTNLVVPRRRRYENEVDRALREFSPDIICVTAVFTEYPFAEKVANYVREKAPKAYMIIGGPHASLQPEEVSRGPFDAVCIGEGEYPTVELASILQKGTKPLGIQNLWIKSNSSIEKNSTREFIENLDTLPFPDREMWRPWVEHDTQHTILLGRGCPYNCTYCCNHKLRKLAQGKYVRFRSPSNVIEELTELCENFPDVTDVYFEVETITANQEWAFEFCAMLEEFNSSRVKRLGFATNVRVLRGKSLKPLFKAFSQAGFTYINLGIESGSQRIRDDVLQRVYSNEDLIQTCDEAHECRLRINAYNMIGLPGETPEDFKKTLEVNRRCLPEGNYLSIFCPYPGTELYNRCVERGLNVELEDESMERFRPVLGLPEFPDKQVTHYFRWFDWYVYRGKRPFVKILSHGALRALGAYPRLFRTFRLLTARGPFARLRRLMK